MSEIFCINGREFVVSNDYFRSLHALRSECNSYTQSEARYTEILAEHDKKVREDAIEEYVDILNDSIPFVDNMDIIFGFNLAVERLEQLKE